MAKTPSKPKRRLPAARAPKRQEFRPTHWSSFRGPGYYLSWLLTECGRLGAEAADPSSVLAPYHREVFRDLTDWRDDFPNAAYGALTDWYTLDYEALMNRTRALRDKGRLDPAKPRITLLAELTTKHNLVVRWYPTGFLGARREFTPGGFSGNLLDGRTPKEPFDFRWFTGDDAGGFKRASNELMYIRGVGGLDLRASDWPASYNHEVVSQLLICAVRASFNQLVEGLRQTFEVTLRTDFEFDVVERAHDDLSTLTFEYPTAWRIVDNRPKAEVVELGRRE